MIIFLLITVIISFPLLIGCETNKIIYFNESTELIQEEIPENNEDELLMPCLREGEYNTAIQHWMDVNNFGGELSNLPIEGVTGYSRAGIGNEIISIYTYLDGVDIDLNFWNEWLEKKLINEKRWAVDIRNLLEIGYFRLTHVILDNDGNELLCKYVETPHLFDSVHTIQLEIFTYEASSFYDVLISYPILRPQEGDDLCVFDRINTIFREVAMQKYQSLFPIDEIIDTSTQLIFRQGYTVTLNTDNIISIRFRGYYFIGKIEQPAYEREYLRFYHAVTIDAYTGNMLRFSNLMSMEDIEDMISEDRILEGNVETLRRRIQSIPPEENIHHFFMTHHGNVCIIDESYIMIEKDPYFALTRYSYFQANPPVCIPLTD